MNGEKCVIDHPKTTKTAKKHEIMREYSWLDNFLVNLEALTHVVLQILIILKHFCWTETVSYK